ncbi:S-adenosylmethionine:tRNA ribosyltransferase-isomerase [Olavius algarvensis spirochete endosymbiont]|uniref:tRNA preQ1(34) S-adenosylmethionine ribosyltransferase-isomerase QueA n=1 Tax=Olavius algarvensis spirochete endosymbiont TaxID=260710 RepID=UPI000F1B9977|nr:tRNA preQ1(34) S-adenosylmethionine ribosyltransferase-isomerase QueA [Olavius algarvensis spirochete endosymbiont]CAD7837654.1 MAG: S-adenosylmethionine:tRNA ribosyltransferase-isomerase (EC 2.4.99.17) [Olavius algarvensis spirochete endosymbiont]VDA99835.1 S-adenosylmethionine:tRNA ribosyltransferase-isomerase [Olavius algarvensis spirochete endosymbiont]
MQANLFSFNLPDELIAKVPSGRRGDSRLIVCDRNEDGPPQHTAMIKLPDFLSPGTVMVFNDTKVRKARVYARRSDTEGISEFLFLHQTREGEWNCIVNRMRKKRIGQNWFFPGDILGTITNLRSENLCTIKLNPIPDESWFEKSGHIPLPSYIGRLDNREDEERYQTVYSRNIGSAAAPTAGLHFTQEIMQILRENDIEICWITLQIGLGTFSPVRERDIQNHIMHLESYNIPYETAEKITAAKKDGRKVLAVGTTTVRTLETSWSSNKLASGAGKTDLFIYPGYRFKVVDQLFTNLHTPKSTLLMLVSAFLGRKRLLEAYDIAIEENYRFFSYGDAMLIR